MREPQKSKTSAWRRVLSAWSGLGGVCDGSDLLTTTLILPVLIGFAVLAIDGSRLMNLNSLLQHAADGLALAAAGELDRRPDACDRAERALANLVENDQRFGDVGAATITMDDVKWRYLEALPASDATPIDSSYEGDCDTADNAALVRYIEVTVDPQNLSTLFPVSFIGGSNDATTNAVAVAGFDATVCDFTPLFICNPFDKPIAQVIAEGENVGKQVKFHMVPPGCGSSCTVTPGNFGLLETATGGKTPDIKDQLATMSPGACFIQNSVTTKPGISGVGDWLNVRFDLYVADAKKLKNKAGYGPATNVRKGYSGATCNKLEPNSPNTRLGRDNFGTGFLGDGQWDFDLYWDSNFPGVSKNGWSNGLNRPTRYEVYQYELENYDTLVKKGAEIGAPICSDPETTVERRIIYAAVLDCGDGEVKGKYTGQAEGFVEMFLTEPSAKESGTGPETIYVEITKLVELGNQKSVARDRVQLFR
jgi:hypothetical protein